MREHRFGTFRVMFDGVDSSARGRAQDQRTGQPSARAATQTGGVIDELVDAGIGETGKLDFGDRTKPLCCKPDRNAGNRSFRKRRVEHAILSIGLEQAVGRAKHAAIDTHVLAEHQNAGILGHGAAQSQVDRLHQADLAHAALPV